MTLWQVYLMSRGLSTVKPTFLCSREVLAVRHRELVWLCWDLPGSVGAREIAHNRMSIAPLS